MNRNSILFCLLFAITANLFTTVKAQVNTTDSLALVDLYNSTDGPHWYIGTNWLTTMPVSTWYGITVTGSRVVQVNLFNDNLNGTIPASIGNLNSLNILKLEDNSKLTGTIPSSIGKLTHLSALFLYSNQLSGAIPAEIGNCTNLACLDMSLNKLSGVIPSSIGNLVNLTELFLNYNDLSGAIPGEIGNLVNLDTLVLYSNQLSGGIPAEIGNLVKLLDLELYGNPLSGAIPPEIGNLINLKELVLYSNQLSGAIPPEIGNLVNLNDLLLNNNQLSGDIPKEIGKLINLHALTLYYNQISGAIPAEIGKLVNLNSLELENNQISGAIPAEIGNMTNLSFLQLFNNQLTGTIPAEIGNCTNLSSLGLSYNQLSSAVPISLRKPKYLHSIDLSHNLLSQDSNVEFSMYKSRSTGGSISYNLFTFNGLEFLVNKYHKIAYTPQNTILPIHQNGNSLSVYAGGKLHNNTYKWFKVGSINSTTITGDSTFSPSTSGKYYATVTNAIAIYLTLYSDTISYTMPLAQTQNSITNVAAVKAFTNHFSVYPNPAKDIIHVQINGDAIVTLTNSAGKILLSKSINNSGEINVSGFANGVYYIQNKTTGETQKVVVIH